MPKSRTTKNRLQSNSKRTSGSPKQKTQNSPSAASYSALKKRFDVQAEELREALEQQAATTEILSVIASSSTDLQPVLDTVAENAARLCCATYADIFRIDGDLLRIAALYGPRRTHTIARDRGVPISRGSVTGRAVIDRQLVHVHDLAAELETEFPQSKPYQQEIGFRTVLATPLLREGIPIGAIWIHRMEILPFTDKQIELLKTFADQAVIAIENVRLFKELQDRNIQLTESLEQQTATSEILRVIASSPTNIQPVLDVVAENAALLCDAIDGVIGRPEGDKLRVVAKYGAMPAPDFVPFSRGIPVGRAVIDCQYIHVKHFGEEI